MRRDGDAKLSDVETFPCPVPAKPPAATDYCRHYQPPRIPLDGRPFVPRCAVNAALDMAKAWEATCTNRPTRHCSYRSDWTAEERAAYAAWREVMMRRCRFIMKRIPEGKAGEYGDITCPGCGSGTLEYGRAEINGHLHARCSTPGCFAVMS